MSGCVSGAENNEKRGGKQSGAFIVEPHAEAVKRCSDSYGIENCKQANRQNRGTEEFEKQRIDKRQNRRLIEIDFAVERLAAPYLFGCGEPQAVILIKIPAVEDTQQKSDEQQ